MEIPQIVSTYIDTFSRHDLDAWLATFAPDGTCSDSGTTEPLSGQALIDHYGGLFAGFPDATIETVALHAITEDLAVWRWILPGCEFIEVREGLVQRVEGYFDRLSILDQLGLVPRPQQEPLLERFQIVWRA